MLPNRRRQLDAMPAAKSFARSLPDARPSGKSTRVPTNSVSHSMARARNVRLAKSHARKSTFAERNQAGRLFQDPRRKIYRLSFSENRHLIAAIPPR